MSGSFNNLKPSYGSPSSSGAGFLPKNKATERKIDQAGVPVWLQYLNDYHKIILGTDICRALLCGKQVLGA